MADSAENRTRTTTGELRPPSLESLMEIELPFIEAEIEHDNAMRLGARLDELGIFGPLPTYVLPDNDEGHQLKLFTQRVRNTGINAYHDIRRVLITYDTAQYVNARDWWIDLDAGNCAYVMSYRSKEGLPTPQSPPMMMIAPFTAALRLSEGQQYLRQTVEKVAALIEYEDVSPDVFLEDTRPFLGSVAIELSTVNKSFDHDIL